MDCDGVLTDGRLYFSSSGEEMKVFDVRDGQGIVAWHRAGFKSGVISGRESLDIIQIRAKELGIHFVRTGSSDKIRDLNSIVAELRVTLENVAYVGDDVGDLEPMKLVGFAVAVSDAVTEVKSAADYVTNCRGGRGAIREVVDLLLASHSS